MARASVATIATLIALLASAPAWAQGKSGKTPGAGHGHQPGGSSGPKTPVAPTPSPGTASFTSWIDDATLLPTGVAWIAVSAGEWNSPAGRAIEAPVTALVAGVSPRLGVGAALPIDTFRDTTGATTSGVGDVSLFAKIGVRDPATHAVGIAVSPIIQISTPPDTASGRQASWALPVSLEVRGSHGRVYGSGGYFSSGSIFATGAIELRPAPRVALTGLIGHTYAVQSDTVTVSESRHRTDVSASIALLLSARAAVFASVGHAFSGNAAADGGPWVAGGFAVRVH